MKSINILICVLLVFISSAQLRAQDRSQEKVFFIGDNEEFYHQLTSSYQGSLLEVCDNSMEVSYQSWSDLMKQIETYCADKGLDIRGAKLWMNIFWSSSGAIDYIAFHPKPNSKKMDYDKVVTLLNDFLTDNLGTGKVSQKKYSHYGSISFPVFTYDHIAKEK